jgi:hypothetical protein
MLETSEVMLVDLGDAKEQTKATREGPLVEDDLTLSRCEI